MQIIAHRGLWSTRDEQNTLESFKMALDQGYGVELDVRDYAGKVVVCHDTVSHDDTLDFETVVDLFSRYDTMLSINIKCDGLVPKIEESLQSLKKERYFCFDMSIPETIKYLEREIPIFLRLSEYEPQTSLHRNSQGIWLDAFKSEWWIDEKSLFNGEKQICIVSPELHGRDASKAWGILKEGELGGDVLLCTDLPKFAKDFFR
jgi:hypothetical protein